MKRFSAGQFVPRFFVDPGQIGYYESNTMSNPFDIINLLLVIAAVGNTFLGFLIYVKNRKDVVNRVYAVNIIFIVLWTMEMFFYRAASESLVLWALFLYTAPTVIASTFLYFSHFFPTPVAHESWKVKAFIFIPNLLLVALLWTPGAIIDSVAIRPGMEKAIAFGPWYWVYAFYFIVYFSAGMARLFFKMRRSSSPLERRQIIYLLAGYSIASNLAMVTNLILPWIGNFTFNWIGQIFTMFMVIPVTYAVLKYQLFNLRVIATEMLAGAILITLFIQIFLAASQTEFILRVTLFALVAFLSYFLIRSVLGEVRHRRELEALTAQLEAANVELKKLDAAKSEFISLASHQLRTPLTIIKGYVSLLQEGERGSASISPKEMLNRISSAASDLVGIIDDLLDLSRIEAGRMQYDLARGDLGAVVDGVIKEFSQKAKDKGLGLRCERPDAIPQLTFDLHKMQQVVSNLVDNSIKYSSDGAVVVRMSVHESGARPAVRLEVEDRGVGIKMEDIGHMFTKFTRTDEAKRLDASGTGIGLYFVKRIVEDHGGKVGVRSGGVGKGSTFWIELPIRRN